MYRTQDYVSKFVEYIRARTGALFHGTDEAHLPLIAEHGLLSHEERGRRGIYSPFPGGSALTQALDTLYRLNDVVFLAFTPSGIMPRQEDRRRKPVMLCIDPAVLLLPGVKVAMGRANHAGTKVYKVAGAVRSEHGIDGEAFEQVLTRTVDPNDATMRIRAMRVYDYEVLVPTVVPPEYIICKS